MSSYTPPQAASRAGTVQLSTGAAIIPDTSITAKSKVFCTYNDNTLVSHALGFLQVQTTAGVQWGVVSTQSNGTINTTDNGYVNYLIVEAP